SDGPTAAGESPPKADRRGDKDRGVDSDCRADNDGEGKVTQHRAPEEKQAKNRDERHLACKNCAAKCLVDALVHDLLDCAPTSTGQAFSDSVVNDNGVVDGVAGDR